MKRTTPNTKSQEWIMKSTTPNTKFQEWIKKDPPPKPNNEAHSSVFHMQDGRSVLEVRPKTVRPSFTSIKQLTAIENLAAELPHRKLSLL